MNALTRTIVPLFASCALGSAALAEDGAARPHELMVGDPAPALSAGEWFKGEPVTEYEAGKIYVVDFWATWCAPCIAGFPHLSELQEKYADEGVVIIGFGSAAAPDKIDKARRLILEQKNDVTRYPVAFDDEESTTWKRMMVAAGKNGLPTAFIVDRSGNLAFIGNPASGMDAVLEAVIAGETDGAREAARYRTQLEAEHLARQFNILMQQGKTSEAYAAGRQLLEGPGADNLNLLAGVAWTIVNPESPLKDRDLDLALAAATRVNELTDFGDPEQLDTLAWAHYHRAEYGQAIEVETRALDLVAEDDQATRLHLEHALSIFRARGVGEGENGDRE